jgi:putative FmdB family regulatory protein
MPTYDYACGDCGGFDAFRPLAERNEPAACPDCGAASPRVFATAPRLALLEGGTRRAMDVNERARHEPRSSRDYQRLAHPAGCGCCSPGRASRKTATSPNGAKSFPSQRPWMISH